MIINKQHVTDYIKCPYLFAKTVLSSKHAVKLRKDMIAFRDHVTEIASYEMKNACKLDLYEYRVKYTNKLYANKEELFADSLNAVVPKLNNLFSIFADNAFFGYNIPVEIAVPGTNAIYRDYVDFGLIDDKGNITLVMIDHLWNEESYKQMLKHWVHYYIVFSYLAHTFGKKVVVTTLDPVEYKRYDVAFLPERYEMDVKRLTEMIKPINDGLLYKNLFACETCGLIGECK